MTDDPNASPEDAAAAQDEPRPPNAGAYLAVTAVVAAVAVVLIVVGAAVSSHAVLVAAAVATAVGLVPILAWRGALLRHWHRQHPSAQRAAAPTGASTAPGQADPPSGAGDTG